MWIRPRAALFSALSVAATSAPIGHTINGSYSGALLSHFSQEVFLGIPFATAPRLQLAQSLNTTWNGTHNATEHGLVCAGFGTNNLEGWDVGEDCLNLNIVRPAGTAPGLDLPVLVWIYGGGWFQGANRDSEFNTSFIVQTSVEIGHPVIAVSINYRLSGFGFLHSNETLDAGVSNLGLRDQWKALEWIQENIEGFGGNQHQVTIWGESAGAQSAGLLSMAYGGNISALFHKAIEVSGNAFSPYPNTREAQQEQYESLIGLTGCNQSSSPLDCLRDLSFETLNSTLYEINLGQGWTPVVDGDIIQSSPLNQSQDGRFAKIPLLVGCNSDEGITFFQTSANTSSDLLKLVEAAIVKNDTLAEEVLALYPQGDQFPPYSEPMDIDWVNLTAAVGVVSGNQTRRGYAIGGDFAAMAPRRKAALSWAEASHHQNVYSFRFDTDPSQIPLVYTSGLGIGFAEHGADLSYEFRLPYVPQTPYPALPNVTAMKNVSYAMQAHFVSFVATSNPNDHGLDWIPEWPEYTGSQKNFVYNGTLTNVLNLHVEDDSFREDAIQWWIDHMDALEKLS